MRREPPIKHTTLSNRLALFLMLTLCLLVASRTQATDQTYCQDRDCKVEDDDTPHLQTVTNENPVNRQGKWV